MASLPEVDDAVRGLVDRLSAVDPELRAKHVVERTVSCQVADLGVVYTARLSDEGLTDVTTGPSDGAAQVRLRADSDDLVAMIEGRLPLPTAWATGRLRVDASVLDLLKLRTLL